MKQGTLKTGSVDIVIDSRETAVLSHLSGLEDSNVTRKQLEVGDYVCSDRVGIERKTISDFLQSILDRRIFKQLCDLSEAYKNPLLIIEGNPEILFLERNIHPNTIRGVLASIAIDHGIPIIWTRNPKETANQVFWIAKREQKREKKAPAIRCLKKRSSVTDMQRFLVAGLPHINSKLTERLLSKFKTPKRVFSAKEEQLIKVEGIGKEKAKGIWTLLNSKYEKPEERP